MVFKFAYLVDLTKSYQPEKFQCSKLSGSSFTEELQKYTDDIIMMSLYIFGIYNFHICDSTYELSSAKFQVL